MIVRNETELDRLAGALVRWAFPRIVKTLVAFSILRGMGDCARTEVTSTGGKVAAWAVLSLLAFLTVVTVWPLSEPKQ